MNRIWDKLIVACGVLWVLLPFNPLFMPYITRDSGVFLYTGWRILNGEVPYRDIWDHKPPVIFYIDALGLLISGNSRWGVWLIEFVSIFLAAYIGFQLIRKIFGAESAIISLFLWLLPFFFMNAGGNITTEYTLLLQFICLWLVYEIDKKNSSYIRWFLIGAVSTFSFFTKQTTIGIGVAIVLYFTFSRLQSGKLKQWLHEFLLIISGSLSICAGVFLLLFLQGGLSQFWSAAFKYNLVYISPQNRNSMLVGLFQLVLLTKSGLFLFSLSGYIIGLIYYKKYTASPWRPLLSIGLLDLPIELVMINLSDRFYSHYYITLIPVLALFAGYSCWIFFSQLTSLGVPKTFMRICLVLGIIIFIWSSFGSYQYYIYDLAKNTDKASTVINYIQNSTLPNDYVLLWGAETSVNYLSLRRSPSRFVYQYPLYIRNYTDRQMIEEFLGDVIRNQPKLIIDTGNPETPLYDFPIKTESVQADIVYLRSHYQRTASFGSWIIYKYSKEVSP